MWSIYTGDNVCEQLPTPEYWDKLQAILEFTYPYERLAITFNPQMGYTDVWNDINFYREKDRIHPTQKPLELIRRLVLASSRPGDLVLDPFMGSGSTAVVCKQSGRAFVGFEVDPEYHRKAQQRVRKASGSRAGRGNGTGEHIKERGGACRLPPRLTRQLKRPDCFLSAPERR